MKTIRAVIGFPIYAVGAVIFLIGGLILGLAAKILGKEWTGKIEEIDLFGDNNLGQL